MEFFELCGNIATTVTAVVAAGYWASVKTSRTRRRKRLETYLKREKDQGGDKGQRTLLHLMANVGLTETEILQASFESPCIRRRLTKTEPEGFAKDILFEYDSSRN